MARGHLDLPAASPRLLLSKAAIYASLGKIDGDAQARARILGMETAFRRKIATHIKTLPTAQASFQRFNTSPFVLMFYSTQRGYSHVSQIEQDIIPAKVFSSMETSAGRMVEEVVLPFYGWEVVPTKMHSTESLLDGRKTGGDHLCAVTLKSGPRCLNDEMAQNIGRDIARHAPAWAQAHGSDRVEFTYGVLYGTRALSNKKDWHVLRSIAEALPPDATVDVSHRGGWHIAYRQGALGVAATIRIGIDWWTYMGGPDTYLELCIALIRACILPAGPETAVPHYTISDLADILDMTGRPAGFNMALLQESQLPWLFFLARHFCDGLVP